MASMELLSVLLVLAIVAGTVALMIRARRREQQTKAQVSRSLGFAPIQPSPELRGKIAHLYCATRTDRNNVDESKYELENVAVRHMPDCDLHIFDLVDSSGGETSYPEQQAVAVVSPYLSLPAFMIFPKADMDGSLTKLGNQFLGWIFSRLGTPVGFPESPEFENKYLVSSPEPDDTRRFLDAARLHQLAHTRLLSVHACGDVFTLSRIGQIDARSATSGTIGERVDVALSLFSAWQKRNDDQ